MRTVSLVGSVSRRGGGLFESVRRLHQELMQCPPTPNAVQQTRLLSAEKISVRVLGLRDDFTEQDLPGWHPIPVTCLRVRGPRNFGFAPGLPRRLAEARADLVHIHGLWQFHSIITVQWHRRGGRPYIVSPHGMLDAWALKNSGWRKAIAWHLYEKRHLEQAACLRALSRAELSSIRTVGLRNPACLIPNGVDLPEIPSAVVRNQNDEAVQPWLGTGKRVLLYLGRIHPKKGLTALLHAWAKAPPPPGWVLVIAGWEQVGHETFLKGLASELGLLWADASGGSRSAASLLFVGPQFNGAKQAWLHRCQAVILPSVSEGLPMAVLEAWAHAKPALITAHCNLPQGAACGAAIPIQAQPPAIVAGLQQLFSATPDRLNTMGTCGFQLVKRDFAWPKIAAQVAAVYRWMCGQRPKPEFVSVPQDA